MLYISSSTFSGNTAVGRTIGAGQHGGAVSGVDGPRLRIDQSTFVHNSAGSSGGVRAFGMAAVIVDCTFLDNSAAAESPRHVSVVSSVFNCIRSWFGFSNPVVSERAQMIKVTRAQASFRSC